MTLEVFGETDARQWDEIINSSLNGTLYHTWDWLKITEKHSDSKLYPLVFFDTRDKKPFGAIPLFFMRKLGLKMVFSPPPGCSIRLGPVLLDRGYKQHKFELAYLDFQAGIDSFIKQLGSGYTSIITNPGLLDVRPFSWADYTLTPAYTYELDLKQGADSIWKNFSQSLKTNIKNAPKRGVTITESQDTASVDILHQLLTERFTKKGRRLSTSVEYLKELFNRFKPSSFQIYLASHEGRAVGATTCIRYKDTAVLWHGGNRSDSNNIPANELLTWYTIDKAIQEGFSRLEIEGANIRRLCDAKARYCPDTAIFFWMKKSNFICNSLEKVYLKKKSLKS